jgi:hypothetical protein
MYLSPPATPNVPSDGRTGYAHAKVRLGTRTRNQGQEWWADLERLIVIIEHDLPDDQLAEPTHDLAEVQAQSLQFWIERTFRYERQ